MEAEDFTCTITRVERGGLSVKLSDGKEAFIPRKETSWALFAPHLSFVWVSGNQVKARYYGETMSDGRMILSIKRIKDDPWKAAKVKYKVGQTIEGPIYAIFVDSVFIEIEEGVVGWIPLYELGTGNHKFPQEVVGRGDVLRAIIQSIDDERRDFGVVINYTLTIVEKYFSA